MIELTILMPCLNEAETLEICIKKAAGFLMLNGISGEVLIADNGSTDGSCKIAEDCGARVLHVDEKGYGAALIGGTKAAYGKYIIMGDADDSYDFSNLMPFLAKLREGYDLVMGNRFKGGIKKGAMPFLHRYLGNPVLSYLGRIFFSSNIKDFHCGLRGYNTESIRALKLCTTGMEYASEMVVKATLHHLKIIEVPTVLSKDGRSRPPHLRSWRDGWRHLKFLLMYSPRWLFLYPGIILILTGILLSALLVGGPIYVGKASLDIHTLLYAAASIIVGTNVIWFYIYTKIYAAHAKLVPKDNFIQAMERITVEKGLIIGIFLFLTGIVVSIAAFNLWKTASFQELDPQLVMRMIIPAFVCIVAGIQCAFSSFFIAILQIKHN